MTEILIVIASGVKEGLPATGNKGRLRSDGQRLHLNPGDYTDVCICQNHQVVHLRSVHFTLCKLFLHKVEGIHMVFFVNT